MCYRAGSVFSQRLQCGRSWRIAGDGAAPQCVVCRLVGVRDERRGVSALSRERGVQRRPHRDDLRSACDVPRHLELVKSLGLSLFFEPDLAVLLGSRSPLEHALEMSTSCFNLITVSMFQLF